MINQKEKKQKRHAIWVLAAHPSWFDENPDLTCPGSETGPETFQQAILTCPARVRVQHLLLKQVSNLGHDATIWTKPHRIVTILSSPGDICSS